MTVVHLYKLQQHTEANNFQEIRYMAGNDKSKQQRARNKV
jgi:hypothetical protein